jgi:hypothetical protein
MADVAEFTLYSRVAQAITVIATSISGRSARLVVCGMSWIPMQGVKHGSIDVDLTFLVFALDFINEY